MFYWEFRGQLHIFIISDISAFSTSIFMLVPHEGVISRKGGIKWGDLARVKIHPKLVSRNFRAGDHGALAPQCARNRFFAMLKTTILAHYCR